MKISVLYNEGSKLEELNFKEINEDFYVLLDQPLHANYKKGEIYYIELGPPIANKTQTLAQFIKDNLSRSEVDKLMKNLSS